MLAYSFDAFRECRERRIFDVHGPSVTKKTSLRIADYVPTVSVITLCADPGPSESWRGRYLCTVLQRLHDGRPRQLIRSARMPAEFDTPAHCAHSSQETAREHSWAPNRCITRGGQVGRAISWASSPKSLLR